MSLHKYNHGKKKKDGIFFINIIFFLREVNRYKTDHQKTNDPSELSGGPFCMIAYYLEKIALILSMIVRKKLRIRRKKPRIPPCRCASSPASAGRTEDSETSFPASASQ